MNSWNSEQKKKIIVLWNVKVLSLHHQTTADFKPGKLTGLFWQEIHPIKDKQEVKCYLP